MYGVAAMWLTDFQYSVTSLHLNVATYPCSEHGSVATLQHLLQLLVCCRFPGWGEAARRTKTEQLGWTSRTTFTFIYLAEQRAGLSLTDLELSLDASFTPLPEVHLGLVVFGHHLHELPGQHRMLCGQKEAKERFKETAWRRQRFDNDSNNDLMAICEVQDLKSQLWAALTLCPRISRAVSVI